MRRSRVWRWWWSWNLPLGSCDPLSTLSTTDPLEVAGKIPHKFTRTFARCHAAATRLPGHTADSLTKGTRDGAGLYATLPVVKRPGPSEASTRNRRLGVKPPGSDGTRNPK